MKKENTICSAFWHIASVRSDGNVHACCRFKYPIAKFDKNLSNVLTQPGYQELREKSSQGIEIDGCKKCYMEEKLGKKSYRQEYNELYDTETIDLKFVDIAFDNICNLACDGCWGEFSNTWAEKLDPGQPKKTYTVQIKEDIQEISDSLERIWFLGGEPLQTSRHFQTLKKIKNIDNVSVQYNTNGSFLLKDEWIEILDQAKKVEISLSVDGYGKLNETVRANSKWADILKFVDQIRSLGYVLKIHTVIHKNNWFGIKDIKTFIEKEKLEWTTNILTYPEKLQITKLNREEKEKFKGYIEECQIPNQQFILDFMYDE
jgi:MoaA/NifB/PqqE/SkfB family radical SAM enzyme